MNVLDLFAKCDDGEIFKFNKKEEDGVICFELKGEYLEGKKQVIIGEESFCATEGDNGYYLIPGDEKYSGTALVRFTHRESDDYIHIDNPTLSFFAMNNGEKTYIVTIKNNYLYVLRTQYRAGKYTTSVIIDATDNIMRDPIVISIMTLCGNADYNDVARAVREARLKRGEIKTLAEKCAERPELEYARRAPLIRIRMGWKPVPSPEPHQTPENEPEMYVACTFSRVREFADALFAKGVKEAEISLVGWNVRGHDGRWPEIFPAEEALGGEAELRRTIAHVQSLGYAITCHTNTTDHYEIADSFSFDNIATKRDGSYRTHGNWAGGVAYGPCPKIQLEYAKRDLPLVAELGFRGLHYIDCISICRPDVCHNPSHPSTLCDSIESLNEIIRGSRKLFGGFASEGIRDFTLGELDFSLYNCFRSPLLSFGTRPCLIVDEVIPLIELTYHGIVLYNPSSATVNAEIKRGGEGALSVLLGGRPSFYVYSKFITPTAKNLFGSISINWMGEDELSIYTDEDMERSASAIARSAKAYEELAALQTVFIKSYKKYENGLAVTAYENGTEIAANLGSDSIEYRERNIAPREYAVFRS